MTLYISIIGSKVWYMVGAPEKMKPRRRCGPRVTFADPRFRGSRAVLKQCRARRYMPAPTVSVIHDCAPALFRWYHWRMCLPLPDGHLGPRPLHSPDHPQSRGTISVLVGRTSHMHHTRPQCTVPLDVDGFRVLCPQKNEKRGRALLHLSILTVGSSCNRRCAGAAWPTLVKMPDVLQWDHVPAYGKITACYDTLFHKNKRGKLYFLVSHMAKWENINCPI